MITTDEEIWKPIKGFEDRYHISNHGRVKAFTIKMRKKFPDGYISIGTVDSSGYFAKLFGYNAKDRTTLRLHVLVGEGWLKEA